MASTQSFFLSNLRLMFHDLWTLPPKKPDSKGDPKYSATFLIEPGSEAFQTITQAMMTVAKQEWGDSAGNVLNATVKDQRCLRMGDHFLTRDGKQRPEFMGKFYFVAKNTKKPIVVAGVKHEGKYIELDENGRTFVDGVGVMLPFGVKNVYGGCFVNAKVQVYSLKSKGDAPNGVHASLEAVQFAGDGTPFGGGGPLSAEGFGEVGEAAKSTQNGPVGSLFGGAPAQGGFFGNQPAAAPAQAPAQGGGFFGNQPAAAPAQVPAQGGGFFGNQPQGGGLFGN